MPGQDGLESATASYEEAVATYEATKAEFEILKKAIAENIHGGRVPTSAALDEEERLRCRMFFAAVQMSRHKRRGALRRS
jgi:hypothetical protein